MGTLNPDFDGETVVVTGGTSGIGRAIALKFGAAGATVVVGDVEREPKDADRPTAEAIAADGGTAEFIETDVRDPDQIENLVDAARPYGGVDVMVNNAGVVAKGTVLELDPEEYDWMQAVNARGIFFGTQAAAADMVERDDPGVVLNTASISSSHPQVDYAGYDASKGAVTMITRTAALELADYDIRVNAVAPGHVATEIREGWSEQAVEAVAGEDDLFDKPVPLGRAALPEEMAGTYLFLASDAASYVTGEMIYVDAGWQLY